MATVGIEFTGADTRGGAPVSSTSIRASEAITSSGTSQATTASSQAGEYIVITASGGAVWAAFGASPTAAAGTSALIAAGASRPFFTATSGVKVAIIDA